MIEVEVRSFVSKEEFDRLNGFFSENSELIKEDYQETSYFDCEADLRIQKNNSGSKIWLKKGKIHDDCREEIEIRTQGDEFENLEKLFDNLGYGVEIKWFRDRKQFDWKGVKVCLDYTKGYGYILELEKLSSEEDKEKVLEELRERLKELGIQKTSKEEFDEKFEEYKNNWRELV